MAVAAPLRVPVELRLGSGDRYFRLATAVSEQGLHFAEGEPLAEALAHGGPLALQFHLPGDEQPIRLEGRAVDVRTGDEAEAPRAVRFLRPAEEARARIAAYVAERVPA